MKITRGLRKSVGQLRGGQMASEGAAGPVRTAEGLGIYETGPLEDLGNI